MENRIEKVKKALKKDFHNLYVSEFTSCWETERFIRDTEIDVMSLDNTIDALYPQPSDQELREKIAKIICACINGDEESCLRTTCENCSFQLPRCKEAADQILALIREEVEPLKARVKELEAEISRLNEIIMAVDKSKTLETPSRTEFAVKTDEWKKIVRHQQEGK